MIAPNGTASILSHADWMGPSWGTPAHQGRNGKGKKEEFREGFQSMGKARHRGKMRKGKKSRGKGKKTRNEVTTAKHHMEAQRKQEHRHCVYGVFLFFLSG